MNRRFLSRPGTVFAGLLILATALAPAGRAQQTTASSGLPIGERIAIARLQEIRLLGDDIRASIWSSLDTDKMPAIIYQPGAWGVAVGFDPVPAGFTPVEGAMDGERPIHRLERSVLDALPRPPERLSPSRVAGRWCVVMKVDPPTALPVGSHIGRRPAEEALADFIGDALLLHLMKVRGASSPLVHVPASWPESAELIALSHLEQKILSRALVFQPNTETMGDFHKLIRQMLAVRRARSRLLGPELAEEEQRLESWEGLRRYTVAKVLMLFPPGRMEWGGAPGDDPAFDDFRGSTPMRMSITHYPPRLLADGPAGTPGQVVARAGSLAFMMDWISYPEWRDKSLPGDRSPIDLINDKVELKPEEEAGYLASAKKDLWYESSLALAEEDFRAGRANRDEELSRLFPDGPSRLTVRLGANNPTDLVYDPWTALYLGEGRLIHPEGLRIKGAGVRLDQAAGLGEGALMTTSEGASAGVKTITLTLPPAARLTLAGKAWKGGSEPRELGSGFPLEVSWPGLELRLEGGKARKTPAGGIEVVLP